MLRLYCVLILLVKLAGIANAQFSISGKVIDLENLAELPGSIIYISDLKTGVAANENGYYQLTNLKSGTYFLEVSLIGYQTEIRKIRILHDTIINFTLNSTKKELSELVVTGVSRTTELKTNPIIVQALNRTDFIQNSSSNIIDALKTVPGVDQITTGVSISKPIIRGLGYNRVITLNNGIRQEGQQWGDEHGIEIDEYTVDRIEIVKGPGSLMYGSDGIAGVINFIPQKSPLPGEIKSEILSNYQSNNNLLGNSISNSGNKNGIQWIGRLSTKTAADYKNKFDGYVYNSGFKEIDGSLFLGINRNWGHSHLTLTSFNNTLNLVEGERDSIGQFISVNSFGDDFTFYNKQHFGYRKGFPYQEVNHLRATLNNYFIVKKGSINADFGIQNNKRKEFADPTNPNDIELFFDLNSFNYNIRYNLSAINGWETSFGIGGMYQSNKNRGEEYLIPEFTLFDAGAFVFTQKSFKKITFATGFRFDNRIVTSNELILDSLNQIISLIDEYSNIKFSGFKKNYDGFSGSVGVSYQASEISTFKLNISQGFRAPNMSELSSNGRHEGTFRFEIGNQKLKSEISHQFDLAYYLNSEHVTFEISPFVNLISNYIYSERVNSVLGGDSIPNPQDPAPAFKFTQGSAALLGGELYFDIHPHPLDWLHLENSFSFVNANQLNQPDSLRYLPFIPAPKYRAEIKAQFKTIKQVFSQTYFKIAIDHYFEQNRAFTAFDTESKTPSYSLISAGIGTSINVKNRKDLLSVFISIDNLTDLAYQSHLSRLKYAPENVLTGRQGVFNMGRNLSFKLLINI
jgi:iron complex outermembrane recepter protein